MIPPLQTTPMTKFIRTLEGQLILAANVALVIVPIVSTLSPTTAVTLGVILNGVTLTARTLLKTVAVVAPVTGPPISASIGVLTGDQILAELNDADAALTAFQGKDGMAADAIVHGLAPDPQPAATGEVNG